MQNKSAMPRAGSPAAGIGASSAYPNRPQRWAAQNANVIDYRLRGKQYGVHKVNERALKGHPNRSPQRPRAERQLRERGVERVWAFASQNDGGVIADIAITSALPTLRIVPPVIALVGVVIALTKQKASDLIITACVFLVALIYYFVFVRPRSSRYWTVSGAVPDSEGVATATDREPA